MIFKNLLSSIFFSDILYGSDILYAQNLPFPMLKNISGKTEFLLR